MNLSKLYSRAYAGMHAPLVMVEVHFSPGTRHFTMVGLPDAAVKESKDRVRSALLNSNFEFPTGNITVNLAPADLPKDGGRFDLAIALGILIASRQLPAPDPEQYEFAGELTLSGAIRPIHAALPFALATREAKRTLIISPKNAYQLNLLSGSTVLPAADLLVLCAHLTNQSLIQPLAPRPPAKYNDQYPELQDISGQSHAKRALTIAAAGGHSMLMVGPPGSGKSMLAHRLPGLLPDLQEEEAIQILTLQSLQSNKPFELRLRRPFRNPHHTSSYLALVGGGNPPMPGEVSLAHAGVLFLDELAEFPRRTLETLREPLENGYITLSRAKAQASFPARFQLIAAMNPCPCGYAGDKIEQCICSLEQVKRYRHKLSGPLLDRIDLQIEVPRLTSAQLLNAPQKSGASSQEIRQQIQRIRDVQLQRLGKINALLSTSELQSVCALADKEKQIMQQAIERYRLSARAYYRILRLARTIADLEQSEPVTLNHLTEALSYRLNIWK